LLLLIVCNSINRGTPCWPCNEFDIDCNPLHSLPRHPTPTPPPR
jgi:hypothetical protein